MKESGVWLSLVERCVRDAEGAGSNPVTPTKIPLQNKELLQHHFGLKSIQWQIGGGCHLTK